VLRLVTYNLTKLFLAWEEERPWEQSCVIILSRGRTKQKEVLTQFFNKSLQVPVLADLECISSDD